MRDLVQVLAIAALGLMVALAAVVLGRDTTIAVPPPESVAEQFARDVVTRRYDRALQYVDDVSGITLTTVRLAGDALRSRAGAVNQVEGEPGAIEGARASARAVLSTERAGRVVFAVSLARRRGLWKITEWTIF